MENEDVEALIALSGASLTRQIVREVITRMTDSDWEILKSKLLAIHEQEVKNLLPGIVKDQLREWVNLEARKALSGLVWSKTEETTKKKVQAELDRLTSNEEIRKIVEASAGPKIQHLVTAEVTRQLKFIR